MTLNQLKAGESASITGFLMMAKDKRRHLLDMGFTRGTKVTILTPAPFGDPVNVLIRGYQLSLRRSDMAKIMVEFI